MSSRDKFELSVVAFCTKIPSSFTSAQASNNNSILVHSSIWPEILSLIVSKAELDSYDTNLPRSQTLLSPLCVNSQDEIKSTRLNSSCRRMESDIVEGDLVLYFVMCGFMFRSPAGAELCSNPLEESQDEETPLRKLERLPRHLQWGRQVILGGTCFVSTVWALTD